MKLALAAACLAATSLFASQALADEFTTAVLQQPVKAKTTLIAADVGWVCEQNTCVTAYTQDGAFGPGECHELAKQVGPISEFKGQYHHSLGDAAMAKCNAGAKPAGTITATR
jgi:hypothetical protein